jgi:excinuclease ABC subunit A
LIDLGPEGGDEGGQVIVTGTPEAVAAEPRSYTGQFLSGLLEVKAKRGRKPTGRGAARANGSKTAERSANGSTTAKGSANGTKTAKAPANGSEVGKTPANGSGNGSGTRRRTSASAGAGKR